MDRITDIVSVHGEGPCWDERTGRLLWVDMFAGSLLATDIESGNTDRIEVAGPVAACMRPAVDGSGMVVVGEQDVQLVDEAGTRILVSVSLGEGMRFNDGGCDPRGRMFVGTLAYDLTPGAGSIWRIGSGEPAVVAEGTTVSNGIGWSADGSLAYFVDSDTNRIDVFDFDLDRGELSSRRPFAVIAAEDGIPDGLCMDAEDGVWVALWGTGTVMRYEPDGTISADVKVDCPPVTACAFGGPNLDTIYVTTSRYEDPHREPPAGSLFAFSPGVTGQPVETFDLRGLDALGGTASG